MVSAKEMTNTSLRYQEVLSKLFSMNTNPKFGLARMEELLRCIGFNENAMRVIQVVGTNGKGSTVAFIEALLREHGISCGLFSSPHLCTARERIRINGALVSEEEFIAAAQYVFLKSASMQDKPSFFECMLAMALWVFEQRGVKVAIMEAGLGGRLDATTTLKREVLGISMIDFDHQGILGHSLLAIAQEKIAAVRAGQRVVTVKQHATVNQVISEQEKVIGFKAIRADRCPLPLGLYGEHQAVNAGLALACLSELHLDLKSEHIAQGLLNVSWPGRFEIVSADPVIVLDGAHNPSGIKTLVKTLKQHPKTKDASLMLVFGSMQSINTSEKIALLKSLPWGKIYVHQPSNPRAESSDTLQKYFMEALPQHIVEPFSSWAQLVQEARHQKQTIIVCGSLYTVGEARGILLGIPADMDQPTH